MPANCPIEIIIADDHPIFLNGLRQKVNDFPGFKLVGEACNGAELIALSKKLRPDIILTDIKMPVMDGIQATRQLTEELPFIGIIGLSMFIEEDIIVDMLGAGAKGYLPKNADFEEVILAVSSVYKNQVYYSRDIAGRISHAISKYNAAVFQKAEPEIEFSEKEIAIIKLICNEYSNKQIADDLGISKRAVDGLRENILRKTNSKNTAGIVVYAIKNKFFLN